MNKNFSSKTIAGLMLFSTLAGGLASCSTADPVVPEGKTSPSKTQPKVDTATPVTPKDKADSAQSTTPTLKPSNKVEKPSTTPVVTFQGTDQGMGQTDGYIASTTWGTFDAIATPSVDPVLAAKQLEWSAATTLLEDARQALKNKQQDLVNAQARAAKAEERLAKALAAQEAAQKAFDAANAANPGVLDTMNAAKAELDKANAALAKAKQTQTAAVSALTTAQGTLTQAQTDLTAAKSAVADSRAKFNAAKSRLEALTASSEAKVAAEQRTKARLDEVTPDYQSKKSVLDEKKAALTRAQGILSDAKANLAAAKKAAASASINWDALSYAQKQEMVRVFLAEMVVDYRAEAGYDTPTARFSVGDKNAQWFADYDKANPLTEDQLVGLEPVTDPNRASRNPVHSNMSLDRYKGTHEGYTIKITGENLAGARANGNPLEVAIAAFKGLRASKDHEAIFLNPNVNAQGIGVVQLADGTWNVFWQGYTVTSAPEGGMFTTDVEKTYGIDVWQGKGTPSVLNASKQVCVGSTSPSCQVAPAGTVVEKTPVDPAFTGKVDLAPYQKVVENAQGTVTAAQSAHDTAAADFAPANKAYTDAKAAHDQAVAALNASESDVAKATADKVTAEQALAKAEAAVPAAEKAVEVATAAIPAAEERVEEANAAVSAASEVQAEAQAEYSSAVEDAAPVVAAQGTLDAANAEVTAATAEDNAATAAVPVAEAAVTSALENVVKAADRYEAAGSALGFNVDAPENN